MAERRLAWCAAALLLAACAPARAAAPGAGACVSAPAEGGSAGALVLAERVEVRGARTLARCALPPALRSTARDAADGAPDRVLLVLEGVRPPAGRGVDLLVFVDRPSAEGPFRTTEAAYAGAATLLPDGRGAEGVTVQIPMARSLAAAVADDGAFALMLVSVGADGGLSPHPVAVRRIVLHLR